MSVFTSVFMSTSRVINQVLVCVQTPRRANDRSIRLESDQFRSEREVIPISTVQRERARFYREDGNRCTAVVSGGPGVGKGRVME